MNGILLPPTCWHENRFDFIYCHWQPDPMVASFDSNDSPKRLSAPSVSGFDATWLDSQSLSNSWRIWSTVWQVLREDQLGFVDARNTDLDSFLLSGQPHIMGKGYQVMVSFDVNLPHLSCWCPLLHCTNWNGTSCVTARRRDPFSNFIVDKGSEVENQWLTNKNVTPYLSTNHLLLCHLFQR